MSAVHHAFIVVKNRYRDSVALLRLASEISKRDGITSSTVVLATSVNLDSARERGFALDDQISTESTRIPSANDVFVGVTGQVDACTTALNWAQQQLSESTRTSSDATTAEPATSLRSVVSQQPSITQGTSIAMISVPGQFAAAEAHKALQLGMHAMVFSDNVSLADEIQLKQHAEKRGLLVMGPDCGTALISGVPLGFVNAVRRGPVAIIGASGTGMQEVMTRVHELGSGISQAIGCGGRDLSEEVDASTMRAALRFVSNDEQTRAVVLVAKPAHPSVMRKIVDECRPFLDRGTPVVLAFTGFSHEQVHGEPRIHVSASLSQSADMVVRLMSQNELTPNLPHTVSRGVRGIERLRDSAKTLVGAFVGGTLCAEYGWLIRSSHPTVDLRCTDFGDDMYTNGRPHPMIDPTRRDRAIADALAQPNVALVHFDIVLGLGSTSDPLSTLEPILRRHNGAIGDGPIMTAHVLATDLDSQDRQSLIQKLHSLGVQTYQTNSEAASVAREVAARITNGAA
jgi:FdrA protein